MTSAMPELLDQAVTGNPNISAYELDGTKVMWWRDRIEKWQRGEKFAPVTMDIAWTRKCNAACSFCYAMTQASDGGTLQCFVGGHAWQ